MGAVSTTILLGLLTCVIIGAIYLRVWFSSRDRLDYFYFFLTAFTIAGYAAAELRMMHALTGEAYLSALNIGHWFAWASYITFLLFIWHYLHAGRAWLFWIAAVLRTAGFVINLISPVSINFTEVTGVKQVTFFGEALSVAVGTRNPLMAIGHVGTVLILFYCIDASITVWRRGDRGLASWVGASAILFIGGRLLDTVLVMWGIVEFPLTVSLIVLVDEIKRSFGAWGGIGQGSRKPAERLADILVAKCHGYPFVDGRSGCLIVVGQLPEQFTVGGFLHIFVGEAGNFLVSVENQANPVVAGAFLQKWPHAAGTPKRNYVCLGDQQDRIRQLAKQTGSAVHAIGAVHYHETELRYEKIEQAGQFSRGWRQGKWLRGRSQKLQSALALR